jgi:hypothetical protein
MVTAIEEQGQEKPPKPSTGSGIGQEPKQSPSDISPLEALGNVPLVKDALDHDWKICDGYVAYSAELLRISLLAISGLAALCLKVRDIRTGPGTLPLAAFTQPFIVLSLAAILSLAHRFIAIDAMAFHIASLRFRRRKRPPSVNRKSERVDSDEVCAAGEEASRDRRLKAAEWLLIVAAGTLVIGIVWAGVSMRYVVLK